MIKVMIVEDSLTSRKTIRESIEKDPEIEVVGEASCGSEAFEKFETLQPDVITTDILMPGMDGEEVTKKLFETKPVPIVVLTSAVDPDSLMKAYNALEAGAFDIYEKPTFLDLGDRWRIGLIDRIKAAASAQIDHLLPDVSGGLEMLSDFDSDISALAVGASAGGLRPLLRLLKSLPESFSVPVLVAYSLSGNLARSLADWFDEKVPLVCVTAEGGESLHSNPGIVFFAPPNKHLTVVDGEIVIESGPPKNHRIPSFDLLFGSLAESLGPEAAAVLLSGTGIDGAEGMLRIREAGGYTACQEKETCAVFDTGAKALEMEACLEVLPPEGIARRLAEFVY